MHMISQFAQNQLSTRLHPQSSPPSGNWEGPPAAFPRRLCARGRTAHCRAWPAQRTARCCAECSTALACPGNILDYDYPNMNVAVTVGGVCVY